MRCARLLGVLGLVLLISGKAEALPELVVNGGFETGGFTGWTLVGDPTYLGVVDGDNVLSGKYVAELGPVGAAAHLTQNVATTPGAAYIIELFIANLGTAPDDIDNHFSVTFDGTLLYEAFDLDTSNQFLQLTLEGIATGTSTLLDLSFRNDPTFFYLDDVSITAAIPEPGSLALLLVGLAGLAAARRGKRSLQDP